MSHNETPEEYPDDTRPAVGASELKAMLYGQTCWFSDLKCPKCGATMNTNGRIVWCSFVGGKGMRGCDYGCDGSVPYNAEVRRAHDQA